MTITVRPAHASELAEVGELTVEAYLEFVPAENSYSAHLADAETRFHQAEVYVAELESTLAGTVTFCPEGSPWRELAGPGEGEFRMLGVHPSARRRGVADALVSLCVERSRELGYTAVMLCSLPEQRGAHRIYQRFGFRRVPERDWSPDDGVDLLAFRLGL